MRLTAWEQIRGRFETLLARLQRRMRIDQDETFGRDEEALFRANFALDVLRGESPEPMIAFAASDLARGMARDPERGRETLAELLAYVEGPVDEGTLTNLLTAAQLSLIDWSQSQPPYWLEGRIEPLLRAALGSGFLASSQAEEFLWQLAGTGRATVMSRQSLIDIAEAVSDPELHKALLGPTQPPNDLGSR